MKKMITILAVLAIAVSFMPMLPEFMFDTANAASSTYKGTFPSMPTAGDTIAGEARKLAFPYGTSKSKYKYAHGKYDKVTQYDDDRPTAAFKEALDRVYPSHWTKFGSSEYGYATRTGASCDVFVGTVVRSSGYDADMPRGLASDVTYLSKASSLWKPMEYPTSTSGLKAGDILLYYRASKTGHVFIYVGDGRICDAGLATRYGIQRKMPDKYFTVDAKTKIRVRPIGSGRGYWQKYDKSQQVKYIQQFLNWAGFDCGTADGDFGPATEGAVKAFQKAVGLSQTGKWDSSTLSKAKSYKKTEPSATTATTPTEGTSGDVTSNQTTTTKATATTAKTTTTSTKATSSASKKKAYTGKYPTKLIKYHEGSKKNIKRWQSYLKWYGYKVEVDGDFGKETKKLTQKFQKAKGLLDDGEVGTQTIKAAKKVKK